MPEQPEQPPTFTEHLAGNMVSELDIELPLKDEVGSNSISDDNIHVLFPLFFF